MPYNSTIGINMGRMIRIAEKISNKQSDRIFSYGYRRLSLLAALINTLILLI